MSRIRSFLPFLGAVVVVGGVLLFGGSDVLATPISKFFTIEIADGDGDTVASIDGATRSYQTMPDYHLETHWTTSGEYGHLETGSMDGATGDMVLGASGAVRGTITMFHGAGQTRPAYLRLYTYTGTDYYVWAADGGTIRLADVEPDSDTDGDVIGPLTYSAPLSLSGATLSATLASQAQAEAGTDNATLMTPLRSAQAIAALTDLSTHDIDELGDVPSPTANLVLKRNATNTACVWAADQTGASPINDGMTDADLLLWNDTTEEWVAVPLSGVATIALDGTLTLSLTEAELETALGGDNVIVETEIDSLAELEAIVGDTLLSSSSILTDLDDVSTGAANGQVLKWNSTSSTWEPKNDNTVAPMGALDGDMLLWSSSSVTWITGAMSGDATIDETGAIDLASTAVTPGTYSYATITVQADGRLTAASTGAVTFDVSSPTAGDFMRYDGSNWAEDQLTASDIADFDVVSITNGDTLVYNAGNYVATDPYLSDTHLTTSSFASPTAYDVIQYNATASEWYATQPRDKFLTLTGAGAVPMVTGGCADPATFETGSTTKRTWIGPAFDKDTDEYCTWTAVVPPDWNASGNVYVIVWWTSQAGSSGDKVEWDVAARAFGDSDDPDAAHTWAEVLDTVTTAKEPHKSSAAALTVDGTPTSGKLLQVVLMRDADDGTNDTLAQDAQVWQVQIQYTPIAGV